MALFGLKLRTGKVRILAGISDREDGRAGGLLLGATTYGTNDAGQETYKTTYLEWGGRSDHIASAIAAGTGVDMPEQLVSEAGDDIQYVGTPEMNKPKVKETVEPVVATEAAN